MAVVAQPTQDQATGGSEALQCLEKNVASLSPACQKAINAVEGGAPAAPPAPAAAKTPAARHHHQQRLLPHRHNPQPLRQLNLPPPRRLSRQRQQRVQHPKRQSPQRRPPPRCRRPSRFSRRSSASTRRVSGSSCCEALAAATFGAFCPRIPLGGGRVIACLEALGPSLSPRCQSAMAALYYDDLTSDSLWYGGNE